MRTTRKRCQFFCFPFFPLSTFRSLRRLATVNSSFSSLWWHLGRSSLQCGRLPSTKPRCTECGRSFCALFQHCFASSGPAWTLSLAVRRQCIRKIHCSKLGVRPLHVSQVSLLSQVGLMPPPLCSNRKFQIVFTLQCLMLLMCCFVFSLPSVFQSNSTARRYDWANTRGRLEICMCRHLSSVLVPPSC